MQDTNQIATSEKRVLIFSAQTPRVSNRQIYFLFSQHQMEDILMDTAVQSVPLSATYIEGVAEWRNQVLPVISLEACLGMELSNSPKTQRLMAVPIRMLTLPIECSPVSDEWIPEKIFTKAVYEWEDGFLVVADMKNILDGRY